jgi:Domain of unknown function (DUF3846)
MATLYLSTGRVREVHPANGVYWTLEEKQKLVGGNIETVSTVDGHFMVINDLGRLKGLELNIPATRIYLHGRRDVIMGDALVIETRAELQAPQEETACPTMGSGGIHTDGYYDGGHCETCGAIGKADDEETMDEKPAHHTT